MSRIIYTSDLLNSAKELISSGFLLKEAAETLKVNPDILSRKLRESGYTIPRHYRPAHNAKKLDRELVVDRYIAGDTIDNISKITGAERRTIRNIIVTSGIEIRTRSEVMFNRMENTTIEDRKQLTRKANEATRGRKNSIDHKIKIANSNQIAKSRLGPGENKLFQLLSNRGFDCIQQFAFEIYNIDMLINGSVAVELNLGSPIRYTQDKHINRIEKILERYNVLTISFDSVKAMTFCIENIISDLNILSGYPTSSGQMKMVRCRSNKFFRFRDEKGQFAAVPSPEEFTYISE